MASNLRLAIIIGTYPILTTTFIDREIETLRRLGVSAKVFSIRQPYANISTDQERLRQNVAYLLPLSVISFLAGNLYFIIRRPQSFWGTLLYLVTRPHRSIKARFKTLLHFAEGVSMANLMRQFPCDHVHAHFADRAATVAIVASRLLDLPYSLTAHTADDIFAEPVLLPEKLSEAKFVATCTGYNEIHLAEISNGSGSGKIKLIYHGLDTSKYQRETVKQASRPIILAIGQLAERKGFPYLLEACRMLKDQGYDLECRIVGDGDQRPILEELVDQLSLQDTVTLCGALPHPEVIAEYERASMFVLPAIVDSAGGRDGIPNVIIEAMAMELPIVSTDHSGIPEVVRDHDNGLLVPPGDAAALAEAMATLLDDPSRWPEMGQNGRQIVSEQFDLEQNVKQLLHEFMA